MFLIIFGFLIVHIAVIAKNNQSYRVARQARLRYGFNQVKGKMNGKPPLT
jgi:hypothetical protein